MQINADLTRSAHVRGAELEWVPSPLAGVERRMLERDGAEVARATSIVRYAPGSAFSAHVHGGGEEFLVLDGIFSDEHGDYPAGSYVRNPVGSTHTPSSTAGCTILVKLHWMHADDQAPIHLSWLDEAGWRAGDNGICHLDAPGFRGEENRFVKIRPGQHLDLESGRGGIEVFVLAGHGHVDAADLHTWDWVRSPRDRSLRLTATSELMLFLKSGHLDTPPPLPGKAHA